MLSPVVFNEYHLWTNTRSNAHEYVYYMVNGPVVVNLMDMGRRQIPDGEFYEQLRLGRVNVERTPLVPASTLELKINMLIRGYGFRIYARSLDGTVPTSGLPPAVLYELGVSLGPGTLRDRIMQRYADGRIF